MKKTYEAPELYEDEYAADTMIASAIVNGKNGVPSIEDTDNSNCNPVPNIPELDIENLIP